MHSALVPRTLVCMIILGSSLAACGGSSAESSGSAVALNQDDEGSSLPVPGSKPKEAAATPDPSSVQKTSEETARLLKKIQTDVRTIANVMAADQARAQGLVDLVPADWSGASAEVKQYEPGAFGDIEAAIAELTTAVRGEQPDVAAAQAASNTVINTIDYYLRRFPA